MSSSRTWDPLDDLSPDQFEQMRAFEQLIARANRRLNLVSRLSLGETRQVHTRHSLALSVREFPQGSKVVDWGTGGGLPGIPLAIRFPQVRFVLVDSIGKKTDIVGAMAMKLGLQNVDVEQSRAETWQGTADFAVSRATAPLDHLWPWTQRVLGTRDGDAIPSDSQWTPGLLALKGGDLESEIEELTRSDPRIQVTVTPIHDFMEGPFGDKFVVEVKRRTSKVGRRMTQV